MYIRSSQRQGAAASRQQSSASKALEVFLVYVLLIITNVRNLLFKNMFEIINNVLLNMIFVDFKLRFLVAPIAQLGRGGGAHHINDSATYKSLSTYI